MPRASRARTAIQAPVFFMRSPVVSWRRLVRPAAAEDAAAEETAFERAQPVHAAAAEAGRLARRVEARDRLAEASSTRPCRSVWMPPRLLRLMMNSRMAISGPPPGRGSSGTCRCAGDRPSSGALGDAPQLFSLWKVGPRRSARRSGSIASPSVSRSTALSPCSAFIFPPVPAAVAPTTSSQLSVRSSYQPFVAEQQVAQEASFFLSRIDGLNSAPETASSLMAILRLIICQEYWRSVAQTCVTRSRVSKPVTSGIGADARPRQSSHSAERGGTTKGRGSACAASSGARRRRSSTSCRGG
jgi:hypothetical protein